ncbi:rhomboid family-domain-containing protein [Polychytrium aggregatum]|uniref:rhomboid family-domain-containing protein n=1 Tax=Polychytrium aggregatum TaxID=110093 RepID=UPI0022FDDE5D|nr:rhomboid family-domain-containing protein [Polychytrium aggregatum]KAI9205788.1 rhomboid family-domain-containing protein [Polychytrium aggregatum]
MHEKPEVLHIVTTDIHVDDDNRGERQPHTMHTPVTVGDPLREDYAFYSNPVSIAASTLSLQPRKTVLDELGDLIVRDAKGDPLGPILNAPKLRQQYRDKRLSKPYFTIGMSVVQLALLIVSFVLNYIATQSPIELNPFNPMIGPTDGILMLMGARYVPCMRATRYYDSTSGTTIDLTTPGLTVACPSGISPQNATLYNGLCTFTDLCGFNGALPHNQFFRFLTPIFLHGGILHFLMNMMFQLRTGLQMERDFGSLRYSIIYLISGIGGFAFGGNFSGFVPSVGCSGSLYGLMACLVLDLAQHWKIVQNPWWELLKMIFQILVSFMLGMLPYIDNFAHIGGFIFGILAGLVFLPIQGYTSSDLRKKKLTRLVAIPVLIVVLVLVFQFFYQGTASECGWCEYLNCIPGMPWCSSKWGTSMMLQ